MWSACAGEIPAYSRQVLHGMPHEPLCKLLVSPLIIPILVPYIIPYTLYNPLYNTPLRSLDYGSHEDFHFAGSVLKGQESRGRTRLGRSPRALPLHDHITPRRSLKPPKPKSQSPGPRPQIHVLNQPPTPNPWYYSRLYSNISKYCSILRIMEKKIETTGRRARWRAPRTALSRDYGNCATRSPMRQRGTLNPKP